MNNTLTIKIERAISELRRGGKLVISDIKLGTSVLLVASELIENSTIDELSKLALSRPNIILSKNKNIKFTDKHKNKIEYIYSPRQTYRMIVIVQKSLS